MSEPIQCPKCGYTRSPADSTPETECPRCGIIYAKYTPRPAVEKPAPPPGPKIFPHTLICLNCGSIGQTQTHTKGKMSTEFFLYLVGIVPGLIYSIWRLSSRGRVCAVCKSPNLIPVGSPVGRKMLSETYLNSKV
jgi:hypothetical protein